MWPNPTVRSRHHDGRASIRGRATLWIAMVALGLLTLLVSACSGQRPELVLDATPTTAPPAAGEVPGSAPTVDRADCVVAVGSEPWRAVIQATATPAVPCGVVAAHQRIEFVNETADPVSFDLARETITVEAGSALVSEPAGTILQPGLTQLQASPHPVPALWLAEPAENRLLEQLIGLDSIGPVTVGMAPLDVTNVLEGVPLIASGADCYVTTIDGDPYSPVFTMLGGTIAAMEVTTPGQLTRSGIGVGASEGDILAAYGARIESAPAPDGDPDRKTLVFVPADEADQVNRLAFELDMDMVVGIRLGLTDPVLTAPNCGS